MNVEIERRKSWKILTAIAASLAIWGLLLALGAYWSPVGEHAGEDRRKLLMIAAMTGIFLLAWGGTVWFAQRRIRRRSTDRPEAEAKGAENRGKSGWQGKSKR